MEIKLIAIGYLARDCSVKHLETGMSAISFSLATTEKYLKNGIKHEHTLWVDCTVWRKSDNIKIAEYFKKGTLLKVEGYPGVRGYKAKSSDEIHASLSMRVDKILFLPTGKNQNTSTFAPEQKEESSDTDNNDSTVFTATTNDDLPF